jgi:hypothetical protein
MLKSAFNWASTVFSAVGAFSGLCCTCCTSQQHSLHTTCVSASSIPYPREYESFPDVQLYSLCSGAVGVHALVLLLHGSVITQHVWA